MKLDIRKLNFSYKSHNILKDLSFSADSGESVFILGENGAGKTTLFRCILGLLKGYSGQVLIDGVSSKNLSIKEMAQKIAYIPQAHDPTFNFTVFQTVLMGTNTLINGFNTPGLKEKEMVYEKLEMLGILDLAHRGYAQLSGGERQLVLIARALVQDSKILIMDEPTSNLDYGNQFRIMEQIKKLSKEGYLVLLSTHNPQHALLFADKVLILKCGNITGYGPPKQILNPNLIKSIYGIDVEMKTISRDNGDLPIIVPYLD